MGANASWRTAVLLANKEIRPHDLLWISEPRDFRAKAELPAWASPEWLSVAPVVVRREAVSANDIVPVGIRGRTRGERFAAFITSERKSRRITPEALFRAGARREQTAVARLLCMRALAQIAPELDQLQLAWGVIGSVGFTLASGVSTLRQDSDLGLLLRDARPLPRTEAYALLWLLRTAPARIDMQVDTGYGGFALACIGPSAA
ncbi:Phosphoribosyl-dephospho-CoA transferase [Caballeronia fortuita]|uniref:Phosphoribosyl-dephospho-CoA transferase n=1 Tax=Caballeronia fortuita TaxID=1777138 RepID=A0A158CTE8_9BURK|nr:malonate decarboxylase holo-ACP synthase [Caballeronia fortuita]SAK85588.1 Phosphoribosyl-dephospho-CoA transferase [Caballeronia fortuita]